MKREVLRATQLLREYNGPFRMEHVEGPTPFHKKANIESDRATSSYEKSHVYNKMKKGK